jgi:hypothetical protein
MFPVIHHADQIIPRLWLGNFNSSQNVDFIKRNRITVIINCTKDLPFAQLGGIFKYRVPVNDNLEKREIIAMTKWFDQILPVIDQHYRKGRTMLIHCAAGMQRSAIIVLAYLCRYQGFGPKLALSTIRTKRPIVFLPYMNFAMSYRLYFGEVRYKALID